jgi:hypothetical protein
MCYSSLYFIKHLIPKTSGIKPFYIYIDRLLMFIYFKWICILFRKAQTQWQKWGGGPSNWKTVHAFLEREFPDYWLDHLVLQNWLLWVNFSWGFVKETVYYEKCKMWTSCMAEWSEMQSVQYQWNTYQYLVRSWISSWCVLHH